MFHELDYGCDAAGLDAQVLQRVRAVLGHLCGAGLDSQINLTARVLLMAALFGPDVRLIADELDLEYAFVETIGRRMTGSGLWTANRAYTEDWAYEPYFDGFFEHLAVAEGLSVAFPGPEGFSYIQARERTSSVM